jgi:two-component system, sensor histidine kinase RegB
LSRKNYGACIPTKKSSERGDSADALAAAAHAHEEDRLVWQARRLRLDTLVGLRWLAVGGQALAILVSYFGVGLHFPIVPCLTLVAGSAVLNLALRWRFPRSERLSERGATILLAYDILQLAGLLFLTGGIVNPFAILLLAPVAVAAASLALRQTLGLLALAIVCATLLARWSLRLPSIGGEELSLPPIYVVGLWSAVVISAAFVTFSAHRVAAEAGRTASALAATELALVRAQHLSQLDGLAAAAAHELSTPLATIALVVRELAAQPTGEGSSDDLELLEQSVDRCRSILAKLSARRELSTHALGFSSPLELAEAAAAPHRLLGVSITVEGEGPEPAPKCPHDPGVLSALGSLIENAVGFAESAVVIRASWTQSTVGMVIADDGPGFLPDILARIGEPYLAQREGARRTEGVGGGLGLGLFIASVFIKRSGGALRFENAKPRAKGAIVTIQWPRQAYEQGQGLASGV